MINEKNEVAPQSHGLLGIPWAMVADIYICLIPSRGELESRAVKSMLAQSWPYSWECLYKDTSAFKAWFCVDGAILRSLAR